MIVKIKINNNETVTNVEVFRRVLNVAGYNLSRIQREEGGDFPKIDKAALSLIRSLQYDHRELI